MALAPRDCHRDALSGSSTRTTDQPRPPTSSLLALVVHSSPSLFLSSSLIFCRQTLLFRRRIASPCCSPPSPRSSSRTSLSCRRTHARSHPRNATVLSPPPLSMCFSRFSRARRTGKEARGLQMRRWLFCTATSQSYRSEPTWAAQGRPKSSRWSDGSQGKGGGEACSGGRSRAEEEGGGRGPGRGRSWACGQRPSSCTGSCRVACCAGGVSRSWWSRRRVERGRG